MNDLRVLVVADDLLARAGLATLLAQQPGCVVVGQIAGDVDLAAALEVYRPDVTVWDLGWEPALSLERLADYPSGEERPPIVALLPDETFAESAWAAGARGVFLRSASAASLAVGLAAVSQGLVVIDLNLTPILTFPRQGGRDLPPSFIKGGEGGFTHRELEVLRLLAEGLPNKGIASRLGISDHTVKFHVNAILGKLGAQSRTEAVTRATRLGLIML